MPGLVVYAMGNPFSRRQAMEYVYGPSSAKSIDPYTPLLVEEVYDNKALVLVADIYSVWPEVGAFPHSETYGEVLEKFKAYMVKTCSRRASPRMCRRVRYVPIPWHGLMGAWRFTAGFGDALLFTLNAVLDELKPQINTVYFVLDDEGDSAFKHTALMAAKLAAILASSRLRLVASEPKPYPPPSKPVVELHDYMEYSFEVLLRIGLLVARKPAAVLKTVTPAVKPRIPREIDELYKLTIASLAMAKNSMLIPLIYQSCGAGNPYMKLKHVLETMTKIYLDYTELRKKPVGGIVRHHVGADPDAVNALVLGVAIEAALQRILERTGTDCNEVYSKGVSKNTIKAIEELLHTRDSTPQNCLKSLGERVALQESCLKKLRSKLLGAQ